MRGSVTALKDMMTRSERRLIYLYLTVGVVVFLAALVSIATGNLVAAFIHLVAATIVEAVCLLVVLRLREEYRNR